MDRGRARRPSEEDEEAPPSNWWLCGELGGRFCSALVLGSGRTAGSVLIFWTFSLAGRGTETHDPSDLALPFYV